MTQATITRTADDTPRRLLRRVDGIELPVAGAWTVSGPHATIAFCVPRSLQRSDIRMGRANEATIVVSDDPDDVSVAALFDVPGLTFNGRPTAGVGPPIHLEAQSVAGPRRWDLTGEMFSVAGVVPLRARLDYHGVWRRGDFAYGWFVLTGAIDPLARSTPRFRFRFELLASGPTGSSLVGADDASWRRGETP